MKSFTSGHPSLLKRYAIKSETSGQGSKRNHYKMNGWKTPWSRYIVARCVARNSQLGGGLLQACGLQPAFKHSTLCKRVDNFWSKIGSLANEHGNLKYPKLYALVHARLSLSHGNAYPKRKFSINKQLLQSHGYTMKDKSIVSLWLKDELIRGGGVLKFPCTIELINSVKNARVRYFVDMELQKLTVETEKQQKMPRVESQEVDESN